MIVELVASRLAAKRLGLEAFSMSIRAWSVPPIMALFFLPSPALGTTSPVMAKYAVEQAAGVGRTVGGYMRQDPSAASRGPSSPCSPSPWETGGSSLAGEPRKCARVDRVQGRESLDAANAFSAPSHLTTRESTEKVAAILAPGGAGLTGQSEGGPARQPRG